MSNARRNKKIIDAYRKELKACLDDISQIDKRIVNKALNASLAQVKLLSPVDSGYLRRSWFIERARKRGSGVEGSLYNIAEYASYVNFGHRLKNKAGETVGYIPGKYFLEKSMHLGEKVMVEEFKKEIEKVKKRHE